MSPALSSSSTLDRASETSVSDPSILSALEIASDPMLLEQVHIIVRFAHDNPTAPCYARFDSRSGLCRVCGDHHQCAFAQGSPRIVVRIGLERVEFGLKL